MALTQLAIASAKLRVGRSLTGLIPVTGDLAIGNNTIYTPVNSDAHVAVLAIHLAKTLTAYTLEFKSNTTNLVTFDLPANSGITHALGSGIFLITQKGEPLVLNSSIAQPSIILYVMEVKDLEL